VHGAGTEPGAFGAEWPGAAGKCHDVSHGIGSAHALQPFERDSELSTPVPLMKGNDVNDAVWEEPGVRFPVTCPICARALLTELPVALIARHSSWGRQSVCTPVATMSIGMRPNWRLRDTRVSQRRRGHCPTQDPSRPRAGVRPLQPGRDLPQMGPKAFRLPSIRIHSGIASPEKPAPRRSPRRAEHTAFGVLRLEHANPRWHPFAIAAAEAASRNFGPVPVRRVRGSTRPRIAQHRRRRPGREGRAQDSFSSIRSTASAPRLTAEVPRHQYQRRFPVWARRSGSTGAGRGPAPRS